MAKVGEEISIFRTLVKEVADDSIYTDQFIYHILSSARALLFKRKTDSFKKISDWEYQQFCVPLEEDLSHNCGCIKVGCTVFRGKNKLPRVLNSRNKDLLRITTLDYKEIPIVSERQIITSDYDDAFKGKMLATITDRYPIIWNTDRLKAVLITGVWEDISEWVDKSLCDLEGNELECFDFMDTEFSIDSDLRYGMYQLSLELMRLPLALKEDITSDNSNVIRQ
jgi:hypothetical protein